MIKALFLDIDGTLVSFETHRVGEPTRNALAEARRRGLLLFIATGRHRCDLNNLGDLAFDGYVTLNGQYCYDARGVIYRRSIDPGDIRTAVGLIEREPFPCLFIEEDRMYINCADDNFRAAQRLLNFGDPPVERPSRALRTDIFQLMPFIGPEREPWLMERLPRCRSTRWNPYFMDVVPEGGSKSVGIDAICRSFGIAPDETMAFGDGGNDISMLRHARDRERRRGWSGPGAPAFRTDLTPRPPGNSGRAAEPCTTDGKRFGPRRGKADCDCRNG